MTNDLNKPTEQVDIDSQEVEELKPTDTGYDELELDEDKSDRPAVPNTILEQKGKITIDSPPVTPIDTTPEVSITLGAALPSDLDEWEETFESVNPEQAEAFGFIRDSASQTDDYMQRISLREGGDWRQHMELDGSYYRAGYPKIPKAKVDGTKLSGKAAIRKMVALTTVGANIQIPLWHSGFWVTIKTPTLSAITELDRTVTSMKATLGRMTCGMAFSNDAVYTNSAFIDFFLDCVYDCTLTGFEDDYSRLKEVIDLADLNDIATTMAGVLHTKGFPYSQVCTNDPAKCDHIAYGKVSIQKLQWVDNSRLTNKQKKFMSKRTAKHTRDEVEAYKDEFNYNTENSKVRINDTTTIVFKRPTVLDHIEDGHRWISDIEKMLEKAFTYSLSDTERNGYRAAQANATQLRRVGHWVKKIVFTEDDVQSFIDDRDTLNESFVTLSSDRDLTKKVLDTLNAYMEESNVTVVGIPNYACPSCGHWHNTEGSAHTMIYPIDAVSVFFTLQQFALQMMITGYKII